MRIDGYLASKEVKKYMYLSSMWTNAANKLDLHLCWLFNSELHMMEKENG